MATIQSPPFVPPLAPTGQTLPAPVKIPIQVAPPCDPNTDIYHCEPVAFSQHPATTMMNPAAPSTQVVAAGVPASQQGDNVQSLLAEYNVTPESLKAQIGPKVATAALFWIGGKILGFFGKK